LSFFVVPWAEAGTGCIATQANVNVGYGPRGLELLRQGLTAREVIDKLLAADTFPGKDGRQVAVIDKQGNVASFTGPNAPNWAGGRQGKTWSAQGNILVGPQVPEAMGRAFEATQGDLAEKLFAALKAGDDAGGDSRGKQSASMLVVGKGRGRNINNDRLIYINVDDSPAPIPELRRLLDLNLGMLYGQWMGELRTAGKSREARDAAAKVVRYMPTAQSHLSLGLLGYELATSRPSSPISARRSRWTPAFAASSTHRRRRNPAAASGSASSWMTANSCSSSSPASEAFSHFSRLSAVQPNSFIAVCFIVSARS
jgi:uncharacterized Ntn-hydrolase superfamily protein